MAVRKLTDYLAVSGLLQELLRGLLPRLALLLAITLAGCSNHTVAPISDRPGPPSDKINNHFVSAGETLYSIAWRYGLDHRKLATANGIGAPYTIFAGQRLNLDLSVAPVRVVATANRNSKPKSKPRVSTRSTAAPAKPRPKVVSPSKSPTAKPSTAKPAAVKPGATAALPKSWKWRWPAKGKVVRSYDTNKRFKGIHIHSRNGTAVKAAAPGVVVYAGNGLHSYGPSIIVKHSDVYLSFYALNSRLLVKEGDRVSVGQKIAEVGGDVNNPDRFYFEIRRDGNATDPIRLLPRQ